jgi:hypothetical protein
VACRLSEQSTSTGGGALRLAITSRRSCVTTASDTDLEMPVKYSTSLVWAARSRWCGCMIRTGGGGGAGRAGAAAASAVGADVRTCAAAACVPTITQDGAACGEGHTAVVFATTIIAAVVGVVVIIAISINIVAQSEQWG